MRCWTRITFSFVALAFGACSTPPEQVSSGSGQSDSSSTSDDTTTSTTTTPGTTTTVADTTGGSQGGSGMDTTMGVDPSTTSDGTTVGVDPSTSGSDGTTMGVDPSTTSGSSSSDGGPPPPECAVPSDCENNETCDPMSQCVPACDPWGAGHYDYCLTPLGKFDSTVLCGEALSCINSGNPLETAVCGRTCTTQCDCAEPPPTGDATVTCGNITGGGDRCYLSCANGETCPDDMICRNSTYCTHPVQPLAMYGDCGAVVSGCADGGTCASGTDGMTTWEVCVSLCPGGDADCDAAPAGAALPAHCDGVISPPMGPDCHLDCNSGADCLPGMTCIDTGLMGHSTLCMWPQ